eukprot:2214941-Pleurochrysis_carterae.AAC.1
MPSSKELPSPPQQPVSFPVPVPPGIGSGGCCSGESSLAVPAGPGEGAGPGSTGGFGAAASLLPVSAGFWLSAADPTCDTPVWAEVVDVSAADEASPLPSLK